MRVVISFVHQPAKDGGRWRYEKEARLSKPIKGKRSRYPAFQISGYETLTALSVWVLVSLVTNERPHYTHPYSLKGKGCKNGYFYKSYEIRELRNIIHLRGLSIIRNPKEKHNEILNSRKKYNIDPYGVTFTRSSFPKEVSRDLWSTRLCVQVLVCCDGKNRMVGRTVSDPIFEQWTDFSIVEMNPNQGSVSGKVPISLTYTPTRRDKNALTNDQIQKTSSLISARKKFKVLFQSEDYKILVNPSRSKTEVNTILFNSPVYKYSQISERVRVNVSLVLPCGEPCSEPVVFHFIPGQTASQENLLIKALPQPSYDRTEIPQQNPKSISGPSGVQTGSQSASSTDANSVQDNRLNVDPLGSSLKSMNLDTDELFSCAEVFDDFDANSKSMVFDINQRKPAQCKNTSHKKNWKSKIMAFLLPKSKGLKGNSYDRTGVQTGNQSASSTDANSVQDNRLNVDSLGLSLKSMNLYTDELFSSAEIVDDFYANSKSRYEYGFRY